MHISLKHSYRSAHNFQQLMLSDVRRHDENKPERDDPPTFGDKVCRAESSRNCSFKSILFACASWRIQNRSRFTSRSELGGTPDQHMAARLSQSHPIRTVHDVILSATGSNMNTQEGFAGRILKDTDRIAHTMLKREEGMAQADRCRGAVHWTIVVADPHFHTRRTDRSSRAFGCHRNLRQHPTTQKTVRRFRHRDHTSADGLGFRHH
jgi:hypothetical protein